MSAVTGNVIPGHIGYIAGARLHNLVLGALDELNAKYKSRGIKFEESGIEQKTLNENGRPADVYVGSLTIYLPGPPIAADMAAMSLYMAAMARA
jgi:hypothetical protein